MKDKLLVVIIIVAVLVTIFAVLPSCGKKATNVNKQVQNEPQKQDTTDVVLKQTAKLDSIKAIVAQNHAALRKNVKGNSAIVSIALLLSFLTLVFLFLIWKRRDDVNKSLCEKLPKLMDYVVQIDKTLESVRINRDVHPQTGSGTYESGEIIKEVKDAISAVSRQVQELLSKEKADHGSEDCHGRMVKDLDSVRDNLTKMNSDIQKTAEDIRILSRYVNDQVNLALESHENQTAALKEFEKRLIELFQVVEKILQKVDTDSDSRFLTMKTSFPDQFEHVKEALLALDKSDQPYPEAIKSFIKSFSFLVSITQLSSDKEKLALAYRSLGELLKGHELTLILPMPDQRFDLEYMDQNLSEGGLGLVATVIYPGFMAKDMLEKALVNVR